MTSLTDEERARFDGWFPLERAPDPDAWENAAIDYLRAESGLPMLHKISPMHPIWRRMGPPSRRSAGRFDGKALWAELHARPGVYRGDVIAEIAWFVDWQKRIPCMMCMIEWLALCSRWPLANHLASRETYLIWTVWMHDRVNEKIGKTLFAPGLTLESPTIDTPLPS